MKDLKAYVKSICPMAIPITDTLDRVGKMAEEHSSFETPIKS